MKRPKVKLNKKKKTDHETAAILVTDKKYIFRLLLVLPGQNAIVECTKSKQKKMLFQTMPKLKLKWSYVKVTTQEISFEWFLHYGVTSTNGEKGILIPDAKTEMYSQCTIDTTWMIARRMIIVKMIALSKSAYYFSHTTFSYYSFNS